MKTKNKIIISLCIMCLAAVLFACSDKTAQTVDGFTKIMTDGGFEVVDVSEGIENETDGLIKTDIVAVNDNYQIEFCISKDEASAKEFYKYLKVGVVDAEATMSYNTEVSAANYDYYSFTQGENFCLISRIDNTILFCSADKKYKDEIVGWSEKLGYE